MEGKAEKLEFPENQDSAMRQCSVLLPKQNLNKEIKKKQKKKRKKIKQKKKQIKKKKR